MKKILAAVLLATSTLFATGCGADENIGYINQKRIMAEAPQMKAIFEEGTKEADAIENELKAALEANPDMSDEDRQKTINEFEQKMYTAGRKYNAQIKQKLDTAFADICKEKNITAVFNNGGDPREKLFLMGGMDITDDVINKLK